MKDELDAQQEKARNIQLAKILGITPDEISQTDFDIDANESNDGQVYNYIVRFRDSSPKNVLAKIKGLKNNEINIDVNAFD